MLPSAKRTRTSSPPTASSAVQAVSSATITLQTQKGIQSVSAVLGSSAAPMQGPARCRHPLRFAPFATAAMILRVAVPESSSAKIQGAIRRFRIALCWWGIDDDDVTTLVILAFVVARCCPPVGAETPEEFRETVLPCTAAGDVDAIRRAAALRILGAERWDAAINDVSISQLLRAIGARVKRLTTAKSPLLFAAVEGCWDNACRIGTRIALRDGFAVVLAFVFGLRVSELLLLDEADLSLFDLHGPSDAIELTIRQSKTRRSLFGHHEPWRCVSAHPLLMRAFLTFEKAGCVSQDAPLLCRMTGSTRDRLSRDWFAKVVRIAAPGCTPHSARVGCATELHAAGASLEEIMMVGRWTSMAALLYVLGSVDAQARASARLGSAGLRVAAGGLRERQVAAWLPIAAAAMAHEAATFDDGAT
jgi:integrase